jgi:uncharacterized protein (DUF58 family)
LFAIAVITGLGVLAQPLFTIGLVLLVLFVVLLAADWVMLYTRSAVEASRECADRFSNGDDNEVRLRIGNNSLFPLKVQVIDEAPVELQRRDLSFGLHLASGQADTIVYRLRPVERGLLSFGDIMVFASTRLGLAQRRFRCPANQEVKVYPSYMMLNRMEILSVSNSLVEAGIKRIRRVGNNTDFEHIKDYVQGDDYRTINWRASARRDHLMVNVYQDERSQQIFSLIDKGRLMQQAFHGMTLLDYAINAALVLSYVAIHRQDKAGLMTFADTFDSFVPAERHTGQMQRILECLYSQQTTFGESDFSMLASQLNRLVPRRSFMVLYTNYADFDSLSRQLPYLRMLNQRHRLLVVFFEDSQLNDMVASPFQDIEECYQHVIGEKMGYERRLIVHTLRQNGIYSLLTTPERLSVDVINQYIEMRKRQLLV